MSSALEILWVEKYRPRRLDEIVNQVEVVSRLKKFVEERNMPHLLFAGPPGTGKTTAAHALARDMFGEGYKQYILELNASVSKNTPILVRIGGKIDRVRFADLDRMYFKDGSILRVGEGEYVKLEDLEVLTLDKHTGSVKWRKASWIIRHWVPKILRVKIEGGGTLELTGNHSVMVFGENGGLVEKSAGNLKPGDYLISFVTKLGRGERGVEHNTLEDDTGIRPPDQLDYTQNPALLLGERDPSYTKNTVPEYSMLAYGNLGLSDSKGARASSYQARLTLASFSGLVKGGAYDDKVSTASNKGIPSTLRELLLGKRVRLLEELYQRNDSGTWGSIVRITGLPRELLIDIAWLARISGIESSIYDGEVKLVWEDSMKYKKSNLLPAKPFIRYLREVDYAIKVDWRSLFDHQLHEEMETVAKEELIKVLNMIDERLLTSDQRERLDVLRKLAYSDLHVVKVASIELVDYNDYVYDISVPENNMFFAGDIPILLHNSDERGINVIREKVKEFARSRTLPGIPFKIIILDEADNMTGDAQQALRRLMELYSSSTRFILIANYPSKIIDPIQSRCAFFRFQPLKKEDVVDRLRYIADMEGVDYDYEALETIYEISEGDMRKAINVLQAASALGKVTVDAVFRVVGLAKPREVREMIKLALEGNFMASREMLRKLMIEYGLSGEDVVRQIHKEVFSAELKISDDMRVLIADYIGEVHYRLVEGSDDDIQLSALLAWLAILGKRMSGA